MSGLVLTPTCCPAAGALDPIRRETAETTDPAADPSAFVRRGADGFDRLDLMAENIHCADCIRKIEGALRAFPAVVEERVNLSHRRVAIAWKAGEVEPQSLASAVAKLCRHLQISTPVR